MSPLLNLREAMHGLHRSVPVQIPPKLQLSLGLEFGVWTGMQARAKEHDAEAPKLPAT